MQRILLMFAYHFPPENVIGAARPARFFKYLRRLGLPCHAITAAPSRDPDVTSVSDPFVVTPSGSGWQAERAMRKLFMPGEVGLRWSLKAAEAARAVMRGHPSARFLVFSTFPPLGSHLAAWRLARSEGLPWIADFRDPLGGESSGAMIHNSFQKAVYNSAEKMIFGAADAVIANTDASADSYRAKHPCYQTRIRVIWNGFDPEARLHALPIPARPKRILIHTGELYYGRNPTLLLESVDRLIACGALRAGDISIRLTGSALANALPPPEFVRKATAEGWLEIRDAIPADAAREAAQTADWLLLLQPQSALQVPGKLFEYLQIGRPILAYVARRSPVEGVLERCGIRYRCVYPDQPLAEFDETVRSFFEMPSEPLPASDWFEQQFNGHAQAESLLKIIRGLTPPAHDSVPSRDSNGAV
jgi:hypothetical protein